MTNWKAMPDIAHNSVSTTEQWNSFIDNLNLLFAPNMAYSKAAGTEGSVVWTLSASALTFRIPYITVNLNWSGRPLMAVWNVQFSFLSAYPDLGLRIRNSYNGEAVNLGTYGINGSEARGLGGMSFLVHSAVPAAPTPTEFWIEAYSPSGLTSGRSYSFHFSARPGLLLVELP